MQSPLHNFHATPGLNFLCQKSRRQAKGDGRWAKRRANSKAKSETVGEGPGQTAKRGERGRRRGARVARVRMSQGAGVKSSVAQRGGSSELYNGLPQTRS